VQFWFHARAQYTLFDVSKVNLVKAKKILYQSAFSAFILTACMWYGCYFYWCTRKVFKHWKNQ